MCVARFEREERFMHSCLCACAVINDIFGLVHTYAGIFTSVAFSVWLDLLSKQIFRSLKPSLLEKFSQRKDFQKNWLYCLQVYWVFWSSFSFKPLDLLSKSRSMADRIKIDLVLTVPAGLFFFFFTMCPDKCTSNLLFSLYIPV